MGRAAATTVNAGEQAAGACPRQGVGVCERTRVSVSACVGPGPGKGIEPLQSLDGDKRAPFLSRVKGQTGF